MVEPKSGKRNNWACKESRPRVISSLMLIRAISLLINAFRSFPNLESRRPSRGRGLQSINLDYSLPCHASWGMDGQVFWINRYLHHQSTTTFDINRLSFFPAEQYYLKHPDMRVFLITSMVYWTILGSRLIKALNGRQVKGNRNIRG